MTDHTPAQRPPETTTRWLVTDLVGDQPPIPRGTPKHQTRHPSPPQEYATSASLDFPRFRGHLTAGPSGRPARMSVDAKDAAVFVGVASRGGPAAESSGRPVPRYVGAGTGP